MTTALSPVLDKPVLDKPVLDEPVLEDAALEKAEEADRAYGWCGLCHSFTEFPHDCRGNDSFVEADLG
jgi:hypothetical protein